MIDGDGLKLLNVINVLRVYGKCELFHECDNTMKMKWFVGLFWLLKYILISIAQEIKF